MEVPPAHPVGATRWVTPAVVQQTTLAYAHLAGLPVTVTPAGPMLLIGGAVKVTAPDGAIYVIAHHHLDATAPDGNDPHVRITRWHRYARTMLTQESAGRHGALAYTVHAMHAADVTDAEIGAFARHWLGLTPPTGTA